MTSQRSAVELLEAADETVGAEEAQAAFEAAARAETLAAFEAADVVASVAEAAVRLWAEALDTSNDYNHETLYANYIAAQAVYRSAYAAYRAALHRLSHD